MDYFEIKKGLYGALSAGTALTALTPRFYDRIAPGTATYPYIIYELQTGDDVHVLDGRAATSYRLLVKAVDERETGGTVDNIMDKVDDLLDQQSVTITGGSTMYLRRMQRIGDYIEIGENGRIYQHAPALYFWTIKST